MKHGQGKFIMKIKQMIFLVFIVTNLVACSSEIDCFTADSVELIKTIETEGSDYSIYLRISGFHEKVAFYELYEGKPTFDVCGRSNILAIYEDVVDPSEGVVSRLVIDGNLTLRAVHIEGNVQEIDLKNVPVEVKSLTRQKLIHVPSAPLLQ